MECYRRDDTAEFFTTAAGSMGQHRTALPRAVACAAALGYGGKSGFSAAAICLVSRKWKYAAGKHSSVKSVKVV
ncbi:hypothetical protein WKI72_20845 [Candidatus Erwinia dacicola]